MINWKTVARLCPITVMFPHLTNSSNAFPKINHLNLVIPDKLHHLTVRFRHMLIQNDNSNCQCYFYLEQTANKFISLLRSRLVT